MTDDEVDQQNFKQAIILFLLICLDVKVFILFKPAYVVVKFYQGNNQNKYCYVQTWVVLYAYVHKKTYYTHEVNEKTIPYIIFTYLFQVL